MWVFRRIRSKLLAFSAVALTLLLAAVAVGWFSVARMSTATQDISQISTALKQQQTADMMHDAIRGDVLAALLAEAKQEPAELATARTELNGHIATFRETLGALKGMGLDATLQKELEAVGPALETYARSAEQLMQGGTGAGNASLEAFVVQFGQLEGAMEQLSETLESRFAEHTERAVALDSLARQALIGIAVLAGIVLLVISGALARGIERPIAQAVEMAKAVAGGQLVFDTRITSSDETAQLLRSLKDMADALRGTVQQVRRAADSIGVASSEIASGNQDLSSRTEQAASSLEQTAASMEELTATVRQSADAARQANQLAASASEIAVRGGQVVGQVVTTMEEINHSSKKISDIIGVIDGIAFQTNILALNAAVEAARAGEQGRGFAVVAAEVRSLAQRSAEAAKEIKGLIGASVDKVDAGTRLVADAGQTMSEIVGSVQRVSDIIGEITAASGEQSDGIGQVNVAVTQLDQMTQQNAALVEESAAAAESLKEQASRLAQVVQIFRIDGAAASAVHRPTPTRAAPAAPAPRAAAPKPVASTPTQTAVAPAPRRSTVPASPSAKAPAAAGAEGDWESF